MIKWFYPVFIGLLTMILATCSIGLEGPTIETAVDPVRTNRAIDPVYPNGAIGTISNEVHLANYLSFVWNSHKVSSKVSPDVDVYVTTTSDKFPMTLYNDMSEQGQAPCTKIAPWNKGSAVGPGDHSQPFCIPIPGVPPTDSIHADIVITYQGWFNLWPLKVKLPGIDVGPMH